MISIDEKSGGVEIEVIAKPKSSKNAIAGFHDGAVRIAITAAPEKSKANSAIAKVLSGVLNVPVSAVMLVSGAKSRRKKFRIEGISKKEAIDLLGVDSQ